MAILDSVKLALRISNSSFDVEEITPIIDACKADLKQSGVVVVDDNEALTKRAIILYAKANFGMENPEMEKYQKAYDRLKTLMALSVKYNTEPAPEAI